MPADQEFLASFAVDVDEQGVARLQTVLEENQGLANEVAAAFEAATKAIQQYQEAAAAANGATPSGGGDENPSGGKDTGAGKDDGSEGGHDLTGYKRSGGGGPGFAYHDGGRVCGR